MVKVGVVGLGFMGQTHLRAYGQIADAQVRAVCDPIRIPKDGKLSEVIGNIAGVQSLQIDPRQVAIFTDFNCFLQEADIDLVDLCVPTRLHVSMSIEALKAGKHVICEKPMGRTSSECSQLLNVVRQSQTFFMPAMCLRFWPEWVWLKQTIDSGRFGRVLSAVFQRLSEPPGWSRETYLKGSESGGALLDLHIHDTDFIQFCFGRPTEVVSTGQIHYSGAFDYVFTIYRFSSGSPSVAAEGSWLLHSGFGFKMAFRVDFEKATVEYDSTRGDQALKVFEDGKAPYVVQPDKSLPDGYVGELKYMIECIKNRQPPRLVTAEDGFWAVKICEAEEESARTGRPVPIC